MLFSVLCLLCLCARLFICALWSPAGKGLTSWLSFVVYNCEFVTFPLVSWVRYGTWSYRFLIFSPLLTFLYKPLDHYIDPLHKVFCFGHFWWDKPFNSLYKVSKDAKIRNRYNQVPHLTQDTNGKVTNSQQTPQTRAKRSALSKQVTTKHI